jgi:hypothetical protein
MSGAIVWPTETTIVVTGYTRLVGGADTAFTVICTIAVVVPAVFAAVMV